MGIKIQDQGRLNEITLTMVNSGVVLKSSSQQLFVCPLQILELFSCMTTCRMKEGGGTSHNKSHFFKYSLRMTYLLCLKENATHMLFFVKCFNNEFSDILFQPQILLYLMVQTYNVTFHILNHTESEIKFLSIN